MTLDLAGSKAGRVLERGRSERVDSVLEDPEIDQQAARRLGVRSALFVPLVARGRAIGVVIAHDKRGHDARVHRRRPAPRGDARRARGRRGRPLGAGEPRRRAARRRGAGARAQAARARAARRDGPGAHLDPARPQAARAGGRDRGGARRGRGRCASSSSRRCRTSAGSRSSCARRRSTTSGSSPAIERLAETFREQTGIAGRPRDAARRRAAAGRGRDRALPDRPGGAHERRQARRRARVSILLTQRGRLGRRRGRGRRRGLRPGAARPTASGSSACASGLRWSAAGCGSSRAAGAGTTRRRRGAAAVTIRVLVVDDHAVVRARSPARARRGGGHRDGRPRRRTPSARSSRRWSTSPTSC